MGDLPDTIAVERVDANTTTEVFKKAGKIVGTATAVVSNDGKTMTNTARGTDEQGRPESAITVWDKQ
jgi:hypothetical protein